MLYVHDVDALGEPVFRGVHRVTVFRGVHMEEHFNQRATEQSCLKNRMQALVNHVVSEHEVVIVGIRPC